MLWAFIVKDNNERTGCTAFVKVEEGDKSGRLGSDYRVCVAPLMTQPVLHNLMSSCLYLFSKS